MTDANDDLKRLLRYAAGECPPEALAEEERWIAGDPERVRTLAALREMPLAAAIAEPDEPDADALWRRFTEAAPMQSSPAPRVLRLAASGAVPARRRAIAWSVGIAATL